MLDVRIGPPQHHERLAIYPLVALTEAEMPYALLADALGHGTVRITEIGSGMVAGLLAVNRGSSAVLVLDGEQLVGAKQNRTTNRSMLLPAKSETAIPVFCMEQGRWRFDSTEMAPTAHHSPAGVRRHARRTEAACAQAGTAAPTEALAFAQSAAWREIADYTSRVGGRSATGALDDLYHVTGPRLDGLARHFPAVPGQVGLLAMLDGAPLALDLLGGRRAYARVHGRLLRGYLLDALAARDSSPPRTAGPVPGPGTVDPSSDPEASVRNFLDRVRLAERVTAPTVGQGTYRVLAGPVIGAELVDDAGVVHLSAFPPDERGPTDPDAGTAAERRPARYEGVPLAPPSRRRRKGD